MGPDKYIDTTPAQKSWKVEPLARNTSDSKMSFKRGQRSMVLEVIAICKLRKRKTRGEAR